MAMYERMVRDLEQHMQHLMTVPLPNPLIAQLQSLREEVLINRVDHDTAGALLQKVKQYVKSLILNGQNILICS